MDLRLATGYLPAFGGTKGSFTYGARRVLHPVDSVELHGVILAKLARADILSTRPLGREELSSQIRNCPALMINYSTERLPKVVIRPERQSK